MLRHVRHAALASSLAALMLFCGAPEAHADFITPLVLAAGVSATVAPFVSGAIGLGLSFVASALTAKKAKGSVTGPSGGARLNLTIDPDAPRQVIFGRAATAGSLVWWQLSGADDSRLHMVIALADHECDSLHTDIWVNGRLQSWNSSTKVVSGFGGNLRVRFYNGTASQTADATLVSSSGGKWTSTEVGKYVCYAVVECDYTETDFPGGIPQIVFVVNGAKLYDQRLDGTAGGTGSHRWADPTTWAFSANSAVVLYNVLRGMAPGGQRLLGMHVPGDAIRVADFVAAANACDEDITLGEGGTEDRYRCNGVFDATQSSQDVIETVLATMAGELIEAGGIYRIQAGVTQSVVAALTDEDLIIDKTFASTPRFPRSQLINGILGNFSDPERSYASVPLPARTSSEDEEQDGGIRLTTTLDLSAVTSRMQGQRLMEVERKRARRMLGVTATLRSRWVTLEPGDWITLDSDRRGYENRTFKIASTSVNEDLTVDVSLREVDSEVDDWSTGDEIEDDQVIDLGSAGPGLSTVEGFALAVILIESGGVAQRPGLRATWTPITDPTVVGLKIEYRKIGDTIVFERRVLDPTFGSYEWADAIQGNTDYEARAQLITQPERAVTWTVWTDTPDFTDPQVVDAGAFEIPPDTITPEQLSPQARFELRLVTAVDGVLGSVASQVEGVRSEIASNAEATIKALVANSQNRAEIRTERIQRLTQDEAFAQQITTVEAALDGAVAAIASEQTARATADSALAASITSVSTALDGNVATVTEILESIDGLGAKWGITVNINGDVLGVVQLEAGAEEVSTFSVQADRFLVAQRDLEGGDPVPVFAIQNVNGTPKLAFRGDMYADGTITAQKMNVSELSAITADFGDAEFSGKARSAPGSTANLVIDFDVGSIRITV